MRASKDQVTRVAPPVKRVRLKTSPGWPSRRESIACSAGRSSSTLPMIAIVLTTQTNSLRHREFPGPAEDLSSRATQTDSLRYLCEVPGLARLVMTQDPGRDRRAMNFVGAVIDSGKTGVAVHSLQRSVSGHALRSEDLYRAVDCIVKHCGAHHFDDADFNAGGISAIHLVGGAQGQQAA